MTVTYVYDAGALIAAERDLRRPLTWHVEAVRRERRILVPAPVLTQVWRGGPRQAGLARMLRGCVVEPTTEAVARFAGHLLARSGTSDAVDAIVAATALTARALVVVTSDPDDLDSLFGDPGERPSLLVV